MAENCQSRERYWVLEEIPGGPKTENLVHHKLKFSFLTLFLINIFIFKMELIFKKIISVDTICQHAKIL